MATKNAYFFELKLKHKGEIIEHAKFKEIITDIIDKYAMDFSEYQSLDATPYEKEMHFMLDIYKYTGKFLFARMTKQRPSNSLVQHDYKTYEKEDVLPGNKENEKGIEQYTYGLLNYEHGIFMLASTMGAPNEKIINNIFERYASEYTVELIEIPNAKAIESIYEGKESEITKLEIEVPLPSAGVLENIFHWKEPEILDAVSSENLNVSVVLKPLRRKSITHGEDETRKIMDAIKESLPRYHKAKMRAKAQNLKLRDYNFFDDKFSYPIDIQNSYIREGERIYYSVEQLAELYQRKMMNAYFENEKLILLILGR